MKSKSSSISSPPGGKLSYIETPQGIIHIQTEFLTYPTPQIVTSVMLNGEVLNKESIHWDKPYGSIQAYIEAEKLLNKQHRETIGLIQKRLDSGNKKNNKFCGDSTPSPENGLNRILYKAEKMLNIKPIFAFSKDGDLIYQSDASDIDENASALKITDLQKIIKLLRFLSADFRCGELTRATLKSPNDDYNLFEFSGIILVYKISDETAK